VYTTDDFREAQEAWLRTQDAKAWETMFFCVRQYCEVSAFYITNGTFSRSDVKDYALKACVNIMARYRKPKGYFIRYLPTVCRNECVSQIYRAQEKFERSAVNTDDDEKTI